jgi:glycosyltransferase involved in cell wall biosynthesis
MYPVSIVIPYFNKDSTIHRAVDSVISQTHRNWELIIIDDSSINPMAMDTKWSQLPIKIYRNETNKVPGPSRSFGINNTKGDFVAFLDADDWWSPFFIEKCLTRLIETPSAAAAWVQSVVHDEEGNIFQRRYSSIPFVKIRETILQYARPWQTGGMLWRREFCGEWGNLTNNQDYYFEFSSSLKSNVVIPVREPLYHVDQGLGNHRSDLLSNNEMVLNQFELNCFVFNSIRGNLNCKSRVILFHRIIRSLWKINQVCGNIAINSSWQKSESFYPFMKLFNRNPQFLRLLHKLFQYTPFRLYF